MDDMAAVRGELISKGVMMPHAHMEFFAQECVSLTRLTDEDVYMCVGPLFHGNAQFLAAYPALLAGARFVLREKFSASGWVRQLRECGATVEIEADAVEAALANLGAPLRDALTVRQRKSDFRIGSRDALQQLHDVAELGGVALQPASARRDVEEQVSYLDDRAVGPGGLADFADVSTGAFEFMGNRRARLAGGDPDPADTLDARQGLSAEAVGEHVEQLLDTVEFAGGVGLEGERQILR